MTAKQQLLAVLAFIALLGGGALIGSHYLKDEITSITLGSDAPGFSAMTLDPAPVMKSLTDYRGEVVLLNIWATWCLPCRTEMPSIEALHQALGPQGLKIVAVSVDDAGAADKIRDFAKAYKLSFELLHDETGAIQTIFRTANKVPETFVIARDGTIRKKLIGEDDWNSEANKRLLALLLAEPKP